MDIFLEDETLTLWRPTENPIQYFLIPHVISVQNWPEYILQVYYTKFNCVSSVLPFDDAIPIIAHQATNLLPTQDYSVLRNYPKIKGLWYKPDRSDSIGVDDISLVGNIKFSFSFSQAESETLLSNLNVYFLEVMDYGSDDESVSRFLLTTSEHKDLPRYDLFKPGGPIYVRKELNENGPKEIYYFLKLCLGHGGKPMKHVVEFMLEEDPWPMCQISAVSHKPINDPAALLEHIDDYSEELSFNRRYFGASWDQTLAGLFAWSLKSKVPWLVYERLHENIKLSVNLAVLTTPFEQVFPNNLPSVCSRKLELLNDLSPFIEKCQIEKDVIELNKLFNTLHECDGVCTYVPIRVIDIPKVLPSYLLLLERVVSCRSPRLRRELMSTMLPWGLMAHYFRDFRIESCMKMVGFIYSLQGISSPTLDASFSSSNYFFDSMDEKTSGIHSISSSPVHWADSSY